jgi:hypothetical protein
MKRTLARAFSAAVATVLISSGLLVGAAATSARADEAPPEDRDLLQCVLSLDLANCLTGDSALTGTGVVGDPLTLAQPVFGLLPVDLLGLVTTDVTWLCNGVPIPGVGNVTQFVPTQAQEGCQVAARTVSSLLGFLPLTLLTDLIPIVGEDEEPEEGQLTASVAPLISGAQAVGGLLSINPGTWLGGLTGVVTPAFSYQWYNAAGPIPGATAREYVPRLADAGGPLAATVTATLLPFLPGMGVTNVVTVAKAKSKTKLSKKTDRLVAFRVKPGAAHPTGKVKLMKGKKTLKTYKLKAADNGRRTVRLPKLAKGTHKIRAVYLGNAALKRSRSNVLRITSR